MFYISSESSSDSGHEVSNHARKHRQHDRSKKVEADIRFGAPFLLSSSPIAFWTFSLYFLCTSFCLGQGKREKQDSSSQTSKAQVERGRLSNFTLEFAAGLHSVVWVYLEMLLETFLLHNQGIARNILYISLSWTMLKIFYTIIKKRSYIRVLRTGILLEWLDNCVFPGHKLCFGTNLTVKEMPVTFFACLHLVL